MNGAKPRAGTSVVHWCLITLCLVIFLAAALLGGTGELLFAVAVLIGLLAFLLLCRGLVKANDWTKRGDFFAPAVAFPLGYILWFVIGSADFVQVPSSISFGLFEPIPLYLWFYVAIGLVAYFLGVMLIRPGQSAQGPAATCRDVWIPGRFWPIIAVLFVLMIASYAYIVSQIGIPALSQSAGEIRLKMANHGVMQAVLFSSAWTIILFLLTYVWTYAETRAVRVACWTGVMAASALLLSLGGRSQLFVPVLTGIVLRHYIKARFRLAKLALLLIAVFCFVGIFGYLRDTAVMGGNDAEEWISVPSPVLPFVYAYLYIRFPVATFRDLTIAIPRSVRFQYGALSLGPLDTLLPGHHEQSDLFFKQVLGNEFIGAGQPATLLGPLYADGGALGIVLGMFLFGVITAGAYRWMLTESNIFRILIYAWIVQTAIFSYFANLFPYIHTLWIPLMWLVLNQIMLAQRRDGVSTQSVTIPSAF